MKRPHTFQGFPFPEHVFVTQKAEKEQHQRLVDTAKAVKSHNRFLLNKDSNTHPMILVDVDWEKQSVFVKNVPMVLCDGRKIFVRMSAACQTGGKKDTEKKIAWFN